MATYDTSTGLRALTGGSLISEIDDGFLALAQDVAARLPTYVTSLPGAPYDGQEIFYAADATNNVLWHLRYRSAASGSSKWAFVGGPSLSIAVATAQPVTSTTYADSIGGSEPSITAPLAGTYDIRFGITGLASNADAMYISPSVAGSATDARSVAISGTAGNNELGAPTRVVRVTSIAAAAVIKLAYKMGAGTGAGQVSNRWVEITPVTLG